MAGDSVEIRNKKRLREAKMNKAIVFYCKECGELFFAVVKNKRNVLDNEKIIIQHLAEGHKIEEIDVDKVETKIGHCVC